MPGKGYRTIGLKPGTSKRLQDLTDNFYPGMFLPSTLIMLMNEVKQVRYSVESYSVRVDASGRYSTMTIRADVMEWLKGEHARLKEEYKTRYGIRCFSNFVNYFLMNLFESKLRSQNNVIQIKESDFRWLREEYDAHRRENMDRAGTFEQFAGLQINKIFDRLRMARDVLTI